MAPERVPHTRCAGERTGIMLLDSWSDRAGKMNGHVPDANLIKPLAVPNEDEVLVD